MSILSFNPTGIVRRMDEMGRVVIPKELRRSLKLRDGDPIEIMADEKSGLIVIKKYEPENGKEGKE